MGKHRYDLSDFEWSVIQPLLPNKPRGVPRRDDRQVLNGVRRFASHFGGSGQARRGRTFRGVTARIRPA